MTAAEAGVEFQGDDGTFRWYSASVREQLQLRAVYDRQQRPGQSSRARVSLSAGAAACLAWLVGHSNMYWGALRADVRPDGRQLGFNKSDMHVRWLGLWGMLWNRVLSEVQFYADKYLYKNMEMPDGNNLTAVTEFFLLGFQGSQSLRILMFCLFLVFYGGTLCGNLLIITLVSISKNLHTPMYFFILQLSINDIILITDIAPNMLHILLNNGGAITFIGCIAQFYFFSTSEAFECFILTVMSYDRYVAICNPLRYTSIMTIAYCVKLSITCWLVGFSIILIDILTISRLHFCGPNIIDHFFCDLLPFQEMSCSDISILRLEIFFLSIISVIIPTIIIISSYANIVFTVLKIPSNTGRQKAFSTCSSHLTVVSIFYWTMFSVYVFPTKVETLSINKILSLLYTVFTPFINPIIYSLRNKDIRKAINKAIQKHRTLVKTGLQVGKIVLQSRS
ncbi:olfactory receptor 5G9-like [Rhinoderma darwinii]|uniref:olfactory receptor 5G9-like n=1 Tax=Rhinoderma darwinii TaxID=43563 RepID=UPI003F673DDF